MIRTFEIHYNTEADSRLLFQYKQNADAEVQTVEMTKKDEGLNVYETQGADFFYYRYAISLPNGIIEERHWRFSPQVSSDVKIKDTWRSPEDGHDALQAAAFCKAIFGSDESEALPLAPKQGSLIIVLTEPCVAPDEEVCVVSKQFINWNESEALRMKKCINHTWVLDLGAIPIMKEFEFKFGIWDKKNNCFKHYEEGYNRVIHPEIGQTVVYSFNEFHFGKAWRAAGVAVPVFSLRTHKSRGCGEFLDLMALADWCVAARLRVIQLLPINDTTAIRTWRDSYPYNAISVMALHPSYISVDDVYDYYGKRLSAMERETGLFLNDGTFLDYNRTRDWKDKNLRKIFGDNFDLIIADKKFKSYFNSNKDWLRDYAAFAALRDEYDTPNFNLWAEHSKYSLRDVEAMFEVGHPKYHEVYYRVFLQFHLERQLRTAVDYAHSKGVALKGDLPIGINPYSADAWTNPELFDFTLQAGAPPDFFSRDGQNWGFPTYKWDVMQKDGYAWWGKRMQRMQQFFDAFRIDHILGFFRIWSIPRPFRSGLMGIFSPALPLSDDEIRSWGFRGNVADYAVPVVSEDFLRGQLGEYADKALVMFTHRTDGLWQLKDEYFKTTEADKWIENNVDNTARERIRTGFANIVHEVLFVSVKSGEWHPRIMLSETERFRSLSSEDQATLNSLYENFFFVRHNDFWKESAERNLGAMLAKCRMLVCGEDLGMIPASVPIVMQRLQILSLEQQRMPKQYWERFGNTATYPYLSVCATSSHDISSIRGWWEEEPQNAEWYYRNMLGRTDDMPRVATADVVSMVVEQHLNAPSMLCINPIQDYAGMVDNMPHLLPFEERINVPSNQNQMWRYRVPFYVDDLIEKYPTLHQTVSHYVVKSGR